MGRHARRRGPVAPSAGLANPWAVDVPVGGAAALRPAPAVPDGATLARWGAVAVVGALAAATAHTVVAGLPRLAVAPDTGATARVPALAVVPPVPAASSGDVDALLRSVRLREQAEADRAARAAEAARVAEAARAAEEARAAEAAARPAAPAPAAGGAVQMVDARVTSGFGMRNGRLHAGVDLAAPIGTPIRVPMSGRVISSGPASGFGLWVRVRHDDGTTTVYGHINRALVGVGDRVEAGEVIAEVGNRGRSTGPHLHFEVLTAGGKKIDPRPWLDQRGIGY